MGRTSGQPVARRGAAVLGIRDRHRDQRKRIIKMCVQKLRDIDDPETVLCRAVLINNTFRTLKTAQRQLLKNARRRIEQVEESSEEEEEGEKDEDEEEDVTEKAALSGRLPRERTPDPLPSLRQEDPSSFPPDDLDDLTSCDLSCSEGSLVHSLIMPPLLSPHIEDMTNCSFYDSFGPGEQGATQGSLGERGERESLPTNLKLTMMKSDLCGVIQENNSNSQSQPYQFPKAEFGTCGSQGETGDSLLDNLLTEIAQA